jgi:peptidoglycan/LPS O-acetylase OafA/YrhL
MTKTLSTRLRVLSFLLIILVVYIHSGNLKTKVSGLSNPSLQPCFQQFVQIYVIEGIARIAVPLFFSISGYLFFHNWSPTAAQYITKMRRRFHSIVIPYLCWSATWILILFILQSVPWSRPFFVDPEHTIRTKTLLQVGYIWLFNPIPYQLWFLRHVFLFCCFSPLIYFLVRKLNYFLIIIAIGLWWAAYIFSLPGVGRSSLGNSLIFFMLGSYLAIIRPFDIEAEIRGKRVLLAAWLCFAIGKAYLITYSDGLYRACEPAFLLLGLTALWCNYDLLKILFENKIGLWFSQWSFFIYAAHDPLLVLFKKLFICLFGMQPGWLLLAFFVLPLITIASDISIAIPFKRFLAPVYFIFTGGR